MYRHADTYLLEWKAKSNRKPLVIRGARQVGKTYLVRSLATGFENLLEINFERTPEIAGLFSSKEPKKILQRLELQYDAPTQPGKTLLFLDEIQAQPHLLSVLRYFYEDMPELHVIAAGSLLEFALENPTFSMPVGRIEYLHLGPMRFSEYLLAMGKNRLAKFLDEFTWQETIPEAIHKTLTEHLRNFLVSGGMPEAVKTYRDTLSWRECEAVKHGILDTFKDDFNKYGQRVDQYTLRILFQKIPRMVGSKFKYVHVDREKRAADIAKALHLLCQARVASRIQHTSGNGVPLGAEVNDRVFKVVFLDVGLMATEMGLTLLDYEKAGDVLLVNRGAVCEQFIAQHLLHSREFFQEPELHYWAREKKNSSAEVDYLIAMGAEIIPVEVKAGPGSGLKSLHLFLREKEKTLGVRFNSGQPSRFETATALPDGRNIPFTLISLPLYLVEQIRRLVSA